MDSAERLAVEQRMATLFRRQHSLMTIEQWRECGLSLDAGRRRVRAGRWVAVAPGVVAVAGSPATWRQRTLAAVLAAGPGAVASHTTAAALFGLSSCPFRAVEITVPRGRSHRSRLATVHESRHLPPGDVTTIDRIPVTRPARTLVDLAACVAPAVLEDAVDDALVRRLTTLARLEKRATDTARPSPPGSVVLRWVLRCWTEGEMAQEVAEMRLVRRLVAHGLPKPALQHEVFDGAGRFVARADAAYPDDKVAMELNGFRWHGTPRGFARDQARSRRLAALGWLVLPVTPLDLSEDGGALAAQVHAARSHAAAALERRKNEEMEGTGAVRGDVQPGMRKILTLGTGAGIALAATLLTAGPAAACGGLVAPNGTVRLLRTSTLAAYANGVEHYVTSFQFAGGGAEVGSIVPLPGIPTKVERGGDWTLQRLARETQPVAEAAGADDRAVALAAAPAKVILETRIDALDLTVLEGGGTAVGDWARQHGFALTPDAPEVLDFYAKRSPIFLAARFDATAAREKGQGIGDGTPIHLTIPTDRPWVPIKILALGREKAEPVEADVYLLTEKRPALLAGPGLVSERSEAASSSLLDDLRSDKGMEWVPDDMWLTYLRVDGAASDLDHDLAIHPTGGQPSRFDFDRVVRNAAADRPDLRRPGQPRSDGGDPDMAVWPVLAAAGAVLGGLAVVVARRAS